MNESRTWKQGAEKKEAHSLRDSSHHPEDNLTHLRNELFLDQSEWP